MASVRVSFPSDLEGMLRSEIWNYKTDPPHNGAGLSFLPVSPLSHATETPYFAEISCSFPLYEVLLPLIHMDTMPPLS